LEYTSERLSRIVGMRSRRSQMPVREHSAMCNAARLAIAALSALMLVTAGCASDLCPPN
jgi:hypothetical protein